MDASNRRPTIGYLTYDLSNYQTMMWEGVLESTEAHDANHLCLVGSQWGSPPNFSEQARILYEFLGPHLVDGIVLNGAVLVSHGDYSGVRALIERCRPLPMTAIARPFEGVPSTSVDGTGGMADMVSHLIEVHGYRKIALIRGPEGHHEDNLRYEGYVRALLAHKIPINPELITGNYQWSSDWRRASEKAIEELVDTRGLTPGVDFDALIGNNDGSAISAIELLKHRGFRVPQDLAVVGYDNQTMGRTITPPLTTVGQPIADQSLWATDALFTLLEGGKVDEIYYMPTSVVIRQSCGCPDATVRNAEIAGQEPLTPVDDGAPWATKGLLFELIDVAHGKRLVPLKSWLAKIILAFESALKRSTQGEFLMDFEAIVVESSQNLEKMPDWHNVLSVLHRRMVPSLDPPMRRAGETLCDQMRIVISQAVNRAQTYSSLASGHLDDMLNRLSQALITTFDFHELMDALAAGLPLLGIPSCFLSLYNNPLDPAQGAKLVMAYDEAGRRALPPGGLEFPTPQLVPEGSFPQDRRYSYVVEALYFRKEQIGIVLFEVGPRNSGVYDSLRGLISSSLKSSFLLNLTETALAETSQAHQELEKAYAELKQNQNKLFIAEKMASLGRLTAGIAHEMNTPLAAVRTVLTEIGHLIDEYSESIDHPGVVSEDHRAIVRDLLKNQEIAVRAVEKSTGFIRGIKAQTANSGPNVFQNFKVDVVVTDTLNILEFAYKQGNCQLDRDLAEGCVLYGDPRWLSQIVTNLVVNAIEACAPQGGRIAIHLALLDDSFSLSVQDSGCGIPQDNLKRILDPFFTTKPFGEGTGLGLSIVNDLVAELKGRLEISSQPGNTVFTATFSGVNGATHGKT